MDSNTVLGRIMTLLSVKTEEEVNLAFARLADGTLLESPTFDVGETVEVVSEDGTKTTAPDGEHELELTGAEGETVRFKIITEGGVITERENVELEDAGDKEELTSETEELSSEENLEAETEETEELEEEEELIEEGDDTEVTINLEEVAKQVEEMAYRIDELEKQLEAKEEKTEELEEEELEEEKEVEAKKLDGAPVETSKFNAINKDKKRTPSYHNSVLAKMYK